MTARAWLIIGIELLLSALVVYVLFGKISTEKNRADLLRQDNNRQGAVIATQSFQFNRFNQIAANQLQYAVTIGAKSQDRQIEYRTILKNEPTCALAVPAGVAGRLLEYANSLRASAMHADPGVADKANAGAIASGTLTYCQAVLWIDEILTVIDIGNSQFSGIRDIEQTRQEKNNGTSRQ